ncbi:PhaM family polyhydroxyalkanoate granule multifunctional regulatory protein [Undibacterium sp. Di24W]|uniref:PhaM family polyhydroxyalkanoate granule multifunctional regulatory protein n=1 Tax=Undibacterium sp. Di24W TaxID=3413033 RepID=UPI003BF0B3C9
MQNPFQQNSAGNMGGMNDPLGFVKKLWGDMQLPGMVTPTLSVDELDKQIKDLKTVESWLTVNMNMLKGTIQALEVQRATISALKTMGESFAQATSHRENTTTTPFASQWPMPETATSTKTTTKQAVPEPAVEDEMDEEEHDGDDVNTDESTAAPESEVSSSDKEAEAKQTATKSEAGSFSNPAAWWTVLQDQFKQALHHAMKDDVVAKTIEPAKSTKPASTKARTHTSTGAKPAASVKSKSSSKGVATKAETKTAVKRTTRTVAKASPASKARAKPASTRKPKLT